MKPTLCLLSILITFWGIGCAKAPPSAEAPTSQGLVRVDEGMQHTTRTTARAGVIHQYLLPEKRFVGKILIYTTGEVKQFDVFAQHGKDYWKSIRRVKAGVSSPIEIRTAVSTDGIRILQLTSLRGEIQQVELYGTLSSETKN